MEPLLIPLNLMDKPAPENLKNDDNVDGEADSMVGVCKAAVRTDSKPTENEHDCAQK
jgi:hypothetical protein